MLHNNPNCQLCKLHKTASTVCILGRGPQRCDVMIIGEAPGEREDESGKPFVGRSGKLLLDILKHEGFEADKIFITNAVSCRPPENRTPSKAEVRACKKWLDYQIAMVRPKFVLLLGNTPLLAVTGEVGIKKRRGIPFQSDGRIFVPTYHPSYALHDPTQKIFIEQDIRLFKTIVETGGIPRAKGVRSRHVRTAEDFGDLLAALVGVVSYDLETNSLNPWQTHNDKGEYEPAAVSLIGFGTRRGEFSIRRSEWSDAQLKSMVASITERLSECVLVGHNSKFDSLWMLVHFDVYWRFDFCTMLAHYILDENSYHDLKGLAQRFCEAPNWDVDKDIKRGNIAPEKQLVYHAHDLYYTRQLYFVFQRKLRLDDEVRRVYERILLPRARHAVYEHFHGIVVDVEKFGEAETYLRKEKDAAEQRLQRWGKINWGSPQQVAKLLFTDLKIPVPAYTKKGKPSTAESALNQIDHDCVADLFKFREAKQQLSFFIDGWKPHLHKLNGYYYLHPSIKLHGTVTGRPSAENPNLYQVPRDGRIRNLVTAEDGWEFVEMDLSQIELRIAAELAKERTMLKAFRDGQDIHWVTALREIERGQGLKELIFDTVNTALQRKEKSYHKAIEELLRMGPDAAIEIRGEWKEYRKKAKAINFGYLYGMWWKKFKIYARDNYGVEITDDEAEASRDFYFDTFSDLPDWHGRQQRFAAKHGYVRTLSGRVRRLPDAQLPVHSYNTKDPVKFLQNMRRKEAWRQAINAPVQSFANEICFMAANQLSEEFGHDKMRICGTVYDAILMRVKKQWVSSVTKRGLEVMSRPKLFDELEIDLEVPVMAEAKVGPWGAGISLKKWEQANVKAIRR